MNLKGIGDLNNKRFLDEAFNPRFQKKLIRSARLRRNVYLGLFVAGFLCIPIAALLGFLLLTILSLFLATLSLVVMTKYDTQLFFLKIIEKKEGDET